MKKYFYIAASLCTSLLYTSCNDFLDVIPDDRATLNTEDKVIKLNTSAYPNKTSRMLFMYGSDNVYDVGEKYNSQKYIEEAYLWEDQTQDAYDGTRNLWQAAYRAISNANETLEAAEKLENTPALEAAKAEALMCRAYGHFVLATTFCHAYNPEFAKTDLGIPYSVKPEKEVEVKYERGTLEEVYKHIAEDIEKALPNIDDAIYEVPKYHFNKRAAYSFAAWFFINYDLSNRANIEKAKNYATMALGQNPASLLRNYEEYVSLGAKDIANLYPKETQQANFLLIPTYSISSRPSDRYGNYPEILEKEAFRKSGLWWGNYNFLYWSVKQYNWGDNGARFPKYDEFWEEINEQTGYPHNVLVPFTADKTLLVRAEANILLEDYDAALSDLKLWYNSHCQKQIQRKDGNIESLAPLTEESIIDVMERLEYARKDKENKLLERSIKKELHPQGFTIAAGKQEAYMQTLLHFRRLETFLEGERWIDIKKYGIEVVHNRDNKTLVVLGVRDDRCAIQLPAEVIKAGLEANPRGKTVETKQN